jgi:NTP pyrophosphatase (non-canonical NTP hydrolase)
MTFDDYQQAAKNTRVYHEYTQFPMAAISYCALGLAGEAGEAANKVKKLMRDGDTLALREKICEEIGDVLWYAAMLADEFGTNLELIAAANLMKVDDRKRNDKIRGEGEGDERKQWQQP